ncbi:hypothetical protein PQR02_08595 [Paraburkholderia sediminicola]|uniref:Uncharacterized protein n=1 Tax=Paraburkholderia rhynchosiae TaxID=487049 RepID=A0ACC7NL54_9BURK
MAAPEQRIFTITIAPGWCDRRLPGRFHWSSSLHATFGPKNFSARLANDCLFDRKVIALVAAVIGMGVAVVGSAQT